MAKFSPDIKEYLKANIGQMNLSEPIQASLLRTIAYDEGPYISSNYELVLFLEEMSSVKDTWSLIVVLYQTIKKLYLMGCEENLSRISQYKETLIQKGKRLEEELTAVLDEKKQNDRELDRIATLYNEKIERINRVKGTVSGEAASNLGTGTVSNLGIGTVSGEAASNLGIGTVSGKAASNLGIGTVSGEATSNLGTGTVSGGAVPDLGTGTVSKEAASNPVSGEVASTLDTGTGCGGAVPNLGTGTVSGKAAPNLGTGTVSGEVASNKTGTVPGEAASNLGTGTRSGGAVPNLGTGTVSGEVTSNPVSGEAASNPVSGEVASNLGTGTVSGEVASNTGIVSSTGEATSVAVSTSVGTASIGGATLNTEVEASVTGVGSPVLTARANGKSDSPQKVGKLKADGVAGGARTPEELANCFRRGEEDNRIMSIIVSDINRRKAEKAVKETATTDVGTAFTKSDGGRKPGRPKKVVPDTASKPQAKKVGRPKKVVPGSTSEPQVKKRGRPLKKAVLGSASKPQVKKRGRPRKNPDPGDASESKGMGCARVRDVVYPPSTPRTIEEIDYDRANTRRMILTFLRNTTIRPITSNEQEGIVKSFITTFENMVASMAKNNKKDWQVLPFNKETACDLLDAYGHFDETDIAKMHGAKGIILEYRLPFIEWIGWGKTNAEVLSNGTVVSDDNDDVVETMDGVEENDGRGTSKKSKHS